MNLLTNAQFYNVLQASTGVQTSTDEQGTVLDSAGYDSVCWVATFNSNLNSTGGYSKLYHQHGSSSESTSMVSCTGSDFAIVPPTTLTGATNAKSFILDVFRPSKRYVSCYVTQDGTNHVAVDAIGILYNSGREPTEQSTGSIGVLSSLVCVSPTT